MRKLEDIVKELNLNVLSGASYLNRDVTSGCCCDLLSWVMAHGKKDAVWITVQTHVNVVAVASLLELAAIIIPSGMSVDEKTLGKAEEEGIVILSSQSNAFQLAGLLYNMGLGKDA